jgi:hypothetical protein
MDVSSISKYYRLKPLKLKPKQLVLDPYNSRIVLDVDTGRKFTTRELPQASVQNYILSVINKQSYHIAELIRGIRASGFLDKGDDMIVKRIAGTDQYLVLEGNRRTTAIKHLLKDEKGLSPAVRDTLSVLRVKEFIYKPNIRFTEPVVIDILLGTIHITGRLPWGPLERAYYVHNSYRRELRRRTRSSAFNYLVDCAQEVAVFFNLSLKAVRKEIIVYRVYEQLKEEGYDVAPDHFSLIEMAVSNGKLCRDYFELRPSTYRFSNRGMARFDKLCIRPKRPINNPRDFRRFARVFKHGKDHDVELVESGTEPISEILGRLNGRLHEREFLSQLGEIKALIDSLHPAEFRGMKTEIEMIRRIKDLVSKKLWRLVKS